MAAAKIRTEPNGRGNGLFIIAAVHQHPRAPKNHFQPLELVEIVYGQCPGERKPQEIWC